MNCSESDTVNHPFGYSDEKYERLQIRSASRLSWNYYGISISDQYHSNRGW